MNPVAVTKYIREQDRLARGAQEAKQASSARHIAEFATRVDRKSAATKGMAAQRKQMEEEIALANDELKLVRQQRLLTLLRQEELQYERELNGIGLAILKT